MKKILLSVILACSALLEVNAQNNYNQIDESGNITTNSSQRRHNTDSLGSDKEIPKGIKVWTVDSKFGDRTMAEMDTLSHMFMNTVFTSGIRGEYNTTGNLGAPRINRIFADRPENQQFIFTQPYDFFIVQPNNFLFTNTFSPFTNLIYNTCGDRINGEDQFTAKFGVNAGKKIGVGFNFDYVYGRGYYQNQSTSHFNYTMYGSYLGDRYQAHLLLSTNHQKVTENGGITDDNYITHPEMFNETFQTSEIPTMLAQNWNRNDNQHAFFTQRYSMGFNRKVKMTEEEIKARKFAMASEKEQADRKARVDAAKEARKNGRDFDEDDFDKNNISSSGRPNDAKIVGIEPEAKNDEKGERIAVNSKVVADSLMALHDKQNEDTMWLKNEFVPVTSLIHTAQLDNYRRIYEAYQSPENFYEKSYNNVCKFSGDSIYDETKHYSIRNTFAISMLEGFNKWAKAGLKAFVTSDLRHFTLPDSISSGSIKTYNNHNLSIGGQLSKIEGKTLHYNVLAETWLTGEDAGQLKIDASVDVNFPLLGDTVTLAASGFLHKVNPTFYYRHYHSKHFWWDNNDFDKTIHSRIQGLFRYQKTRTTLRVAIDELKNYTYFSMSSIDRYQNTISVKQESSTISLITASLGQDLTIGPLNWESVITFQKSTDNEVLPVPDLNIYTNLYLRFKIARVLSCDFGADIRYFTKYYAPNYTPGLGQYAVQIGNDRLEVGNYPIANVYANFNLKHTRFFVMMSHANAGTGKRNYFLTPHNPLNGSIIRFGLSWNFFN